MFECEWSSFIMDNEIRKEEFWEWYRNPDNYRPGLLGTNRSHEHE